MPTQTESATRTDLTAKYGQVWDTQELQRDFVVLGFSLCLVVVKRKSDGVLGSLDFTHSPRFYHSFQADGSHATQSA